MASNQEGENEKLKKGEDHKSDNEDNQQDKKGPELNISSKRHHQKSRERKDAKGKEKKSDDRDSFRTRSGIAVNFAPNKPSKSRFENEASSRAASNLPRKRSKSREHNRKRSDSRADRQEAVGRSRRDKYEHQKQSCSDKRMRRSRSPKPQRDVDRADRGHHRRSQESRHYHEQRGPLRKTKDDRNNEKRTNRTETDRAASRERSNTRALSPMPLQIEDRRSDADPQKARPTTPEVPEATCKLDDANRGNVQQEPPIEEEIQWVLKDLKIPPVRLITYEPTPEELSISPENVPTSGELVPVQPGVNVGMGHQEQYNDRGARNQSQEQFNHYQPNPVHAYQNEPAGNSQRGLQDPGPSPWSNEHARYLYAQHWAGHAARFGGRSSTFRGPETGQHRPASRNPHVNFHHPEAVYWRREEVRYIYQCCDEHQKTFLSNRLTGFVQTRSKKLVHFSRMSDHAFAKEVASDQWLYLFFFEELKKVQESQMREWSGPSDASSFSSQRNLQGTNPQPGPSGRQGNASGSVPSSTCTSSSSSSKRFPRENIGSSARATSSTACSSGQGTSRSNEQPITTVQISQRPSPKSYLPAEFYERKTSIRPNNREVQRLSIAETGMSRDVKEETVNFHSRSGAERTTFRPGNVQWPTDQQNPDYRQQGRITISDPRLRARVFRQLEEEEEEETLAEERSYNERIKDDVEKNSNTAPSTSQNNDKSASPSHFSSLLPRSLATSEDKSRLEEVVQYVLQEQARGNDRSGFKFDPLAPVDSPLKLKDILHNHRKLVDFLGLEWVISANNIDPLMLQKKEEELIKTAPDKRGWAVDYEGIVDSCDDRRDYIFKRRLYFKACQLKFGERLLIEKMMREETRLKRESGTSRAPDMVVVLQNVFHNHQSRPTAETSYNLRIPKI